MRTPFVTPRLTRSRGEGISESREKTSENYGLRPGTSLMCPDSIGESIEEKEV
jgi:hypothetical protein